MTTLIDRKAEIGVILIASTFLVYILVMMWVDSLPLGQRYLPSNVQESIPILQNGLIISGILFYIAGRKRFLSHTKHTIGPALSLFFGSLLLILGALGVYTKFGLMEYYHHKVAHLGIPFSSIFIEEFPWLLMSILLAISGIILAIDSWKILSVLDQKNILTEQQ